MKKKIFDRRHTRTGADKRFTTEGHGFTQKRISLESRKHEGTKGTKEYRINRRRTQTDRTTWKLKNELFADEN
jgi:hypothetical protein